MPAIAAPNRPSPAPATGPAFLRLEGIRVEHRDAGGVRSVGLAIDRLVVAPGEVVALTGPSGAGKSTFLELVSGLRRPDAGRVLWGESEVSAFGEAAREAWRRRCVGFVFQDFHLVAELSILDNVLLPQSFAGFRVPTAARSRAADLIAAAGLPDARRRAGLLSRGEQQRVAVARALLADPPLLIADEPTASLDPATGAAIADLILAAARARGATLLMASHDPLLTARADRILRLEAGHLVDPATLSRAEAAAIPSPGAAA
jgi:ABC-type lipoprotein export system ATPase subunit